MTIDGVPRTGSSPLTWLSIGQIHSDADAKQMLRAAARLLERPCYLVLTSDVREEFLLGPGAASSHVKTVYEYATSAASTDPFPQELWYNYSEYVLDAELAYKEKDLLGPAKEQDVVI